MLPKGGKNLPRPHDTRRYTADIAAALRSELGGSHQATKTLMRWTGASEKTVKNWMAEVRGPTGAHLISLMARSSAVLEAVLRLSNREAWIVVGGIRGLQSEMETRIDHLMQMLRSGPA
jgi:hypothetical protein